ncbi:sodium:galactoside symporter [Duganella sp. FT94W]|uniref:Sodium:galactoside symporter n=1 Tax=Duganella lactea TaxID=2692173 RepID=A0ABW9V841_9BURK|nr:MFS transporter [Duganella lactea]MYM35801.1 sodium:galactoside symporter [Duganella lactea]
MSNAAYGLLGAPLAMAALPLFVQLPAYYASHLGMALGPLGMVLFIARGIDMLQDPLLGHLLDRRPAQHRRWMTLGAVVLVLAFAALWLPPVGIGAGALSLWIALMLVLAYGAHSLINIAYLTWGSQLHGPLGAAAWREALGLAGMMAASLAPAAILGGDTAQVRPLLALYSMAFGLLMVSAMWALLRHAPQVATPTSIQTQGWRDTLRELAGNRPVRALLLPYFLNALSVAIPATLALFYIADQLGAPQLSGVFLACYFGAAACGLPVWARLAQTHGALRCWRAGMLLAVAGFCGAALLGSGDVVLYAAVCIAAGAALGADLALPPVLLGRLLGQRAGAGFGLFTLLGKLALAIAGLTLPLLSWLDYRPGQGGGVSLVLAYAVLPCLIKLLAMAALSRCTETLGSNT